jgi:O-antigen ligase
MHLPFLRGLPRPILRYPPIETGMGVMLVVLVGAMGVAPRLVPVLVVALALLTALSALGSAEKLAATARSAVASPAGLSWLAFSTYALLSALWSADPAFAALTVLQAAAVLMSAVYLAVALPPLLATLDDRRRRWFMRGIPIGATFALGFILIEELTGHALVLKALAAFPGLLGDNAKEIVRAGGRIVGIEPYYLNPSVASALLLAPPLLLALSLWRPKGLRAIVLTLASLAAGAAVLLSVSETAKIAALAAIVAFAFARRWPRGTLHVLAAILVLGTVLALPIGRLPYALELQDVDWLPVSARERVLIWHHTAETAARRPLFGIGAQSTRFQETAVTASRPADILDRQLGWHAHNVYLQSWLELGAAGTLLLLAAGLAAVRAALALHPAALAFAAALVASVMTIAATGWGMWQPWLIGNVAAAAVLLAMLDRDLRLRSPPPA